MNKYANRIYIELSDIILVVVVVIRVCVFTYLLFITCVNNMLFLYLVWCDVCYSICLPTDLTFYDIFIYNLLTISVMFIFSHGVGDDLLFKILYWNCDCTTNNIYLLWLYVIIDVLFANSIWYVCWFIISHLL